MKKLLLVITAVVMIIALCSCSPRDTETTAGKQIEKMIQEVFEVFESEGLDMPETYDELDSNSKPLKLSEEEWMELLAENPAWVSEITFPPTLLFFDSDGTFYFESCNTTQFFCGDNEWDTWEYSEEEGCLLLFDEKEVYYAFSYQGQTVIVSEHSFDGFLSGMYSSPSIYFAASGYTADPPEGSSDTALAGNWKIDVEDIDYTMDWTFQTDGVLLDDLYSVVGPEEHRWMMTDDDTCYILFSNWWGEENTRLWIEYDVEWHEDGSVTLTHVSNPYLHVLHFYK